MDPHLPQGLLRVALADDSATFRSILRRAVGDWGGAHLVGLAKDGREALDLLASVPVDVLLLDVTMPILDGIGTLEEVRRLHRGVEVIMCSGVDRSQGNLTLQALSLGALDFIIKPQSESPSESFTALCHALHPLLNIVRERRAGTPSPLGSETTAPSFGGMPSPPRPLRGATVVPPTVPPPAPVETISHTTVSDVSIPSTSPAVPSPVVARIPRPSSAPLTPPHSETVRNLLRPVSAVATVRRPPVHPQLLVIGVSTGGPNALQMVIPVLPADLGIPVLVVQHMPPVFTASLAERLDRLSALRVEEAAHGRPIVPGVVLIAPGGRHLEVEERPGGIRTRIHDGALVHSCRPSVDVLFRSVAAVCGGAVICAVLTGMGNDGAEGVCDLRRKGAWSVVQDRDSSVVWGMPGAVVQAGEADEILPLSQVGPRLAELGKGRSV